jgi:hypothetical protein
VAGTFIRQSDRATADASAGWIRIASARNTDPQHASAAPLLGRRGGDVPQCRIHPGIFAR